MTPPGRGRGRPPQFTGAARTRYLAARRTGASQKAAAALAGITDRALRKTRNADPGFRAQDDAAAAEGRRVRIASLPHDEYRYNHHRCRCLVCTKAATAARAGRPDRAGTRAGGAPVVAIDPPTKGSPEDFPLARAS